LFRLSLEAAAGLLSAPKFQAPEIHSAQDTAERMRKSLGRSEGGGVTQWAQAGGELATTYNAK